MPTSLPMTTVSAAAASAAVTVAAGFGVTSAEPLILSDGANVIVHLSPSPVVAKVAATTMLVRPDVAAWLQRELDVASFLTGGNVPVLAPSAEIPATTHTADGHVMSFWRYHRRSGDALPDESAIGSMLRDVHAALRGYPGALGLLTPLDDIPGFLARPGTQLGAADRTMLGEAFERLTAELDPDSCAVQSLHGDAGAGNLMAADTGWPRRPGRSKCPRNRARPGRVLRQGGALAGRVVRQGRAGQRRHRGGRLRESWCPHRGPAIVLEVRTAMGRPVRKESS
jgi:hypothetical protein